jgi:hypothetical protein
VNPDQKRHYDRAERLLAVAGNQVSHLAQQAVLLEAQVHATLAIAAHDLQYAQIADLDGRTSRAAPKAAS